MDLRNQDSEAGSYGFNFQGHQLPPDAPCALCPHKTVHEGKCSTRFQVTCDRVSCSKTKSGTEKFHEHPSGTTSSRGISRRKTGNTISRRAQSRGKNPNTISDRAQSSRGDHDPSEIRTDTDICKHKYLPDLADGVRTRSVKVMRPPEPWDRTPMVFSWTANETHRTQDVCRILDPPPNFGR